MTQITVNSNDFDLKYKCETISDLSKHIVKDLGSGSIITHMRIEDELVEFNEEDELLLQSLSSIERISFITTTNIELAFEALNSCSGYIDTLNKKILELCNYYRSGDIQKAESLFDEVIDILDLYIQLVSKIFSTLRSHRRSLLESNKEIQDLEIHLLSILKALIPAKERKDFIMLCDLLEYELVDNLTQWKIKVIPNLKKLQNS